MTELAKRRERASLPSRALKLLGVVLFFIVVSMPRIAHADDTSTISEAKRLFVEGNSLLDAGRYTEALTALTQSRNLVRSPNTTLLVARCLLGLGRRVEAYETFGVSEDEARRRILAGEARYEQTAAAAAAERAELARTLGTIVVRVPAAAAGVSVDGAPVNVPDRGEANVVHEPGQAEIAIRLVSGDERHRAVSVMAGATVVIDFVDVSERTSTTPSRSEHAGRAWTRPAAWTSAAVALVGIGTFTVCGLRTQSLYEDLEQRCAHGCGTDAESLVREGERTQTIANVGLVVAGVAALATVAFLALGAM